MAAGVHCDRREPEPSPTPTTKPQQSDNLYCQCCREQSLLGDLWADDKGSLSLYRWRTKDSPCPIFSGNSNSNDGYNVFNLLCLSWHTNTRSLSLACWINTHFSTWNHALLYLIYSPKCLIIFPVSMCHLDFLPRGAHSLMFSRHPYELRSKTTWKSDSRLNIYYYLFISSAGMTKPNSAVGSCVVLVAEEQKQADIFRTKTMEEASLGRWWFSAALSLRTVNYSGLYYQII